MAPSGFSFAGLVEVHPRSTLGRVLLQDRVGRAEAPVLPVREYLLLDGLRPGAMEGQDVRLWVSHMFLEADAAVEAETAATERLLALSGKPADVVLHGVVALRPEAIMLALGEEPRSLFRVVAGRKGPGHGQRIFGIDILAYHEDFAEAAADVIFSPYEVAKLVHELVQGPAG